MVLTGPRTSLMQVQLRFPSLRLDLLDMQMDAFPSPRDQVAREWLNICHSWC